MTPEQLKALAIELAAAMPPVEPERVFLVGGEAFTEEALAVARDQAVIPQINYASAPALEVWGYALDPARYTNAPQQVSGEIEAAFDAVTAGIERRKGDFEEDFINGVYYGLVSMKAELKRLRATPESSGADS